VAVLKDCYPYLGTNCRILLSLALTASATWRIGYFSRGNIGLGVPSPRCGRTLPTTTPAARETSTRPHASWLKICPGSSSSANAIESFYDIPTRANRGARRDAYDVPTLQPFERADLDHWLCVTRRTTHRLPSRRAESVASAGADSTVTTCAIQFAPRSVCYEALSLTEIDIWPSGLDSPSDPHLIRLNSDKGTKTLIGCFAPFYARRTFGNWVLGSGLSNGLSTIHSTKLGKSPRTK
jgi:hypothetical protein